MAAWLALLAVPRSLSASDTVLSGAALKEGAVTISSWQFRAGDDASWSGPDFDDKGWIFLEDPVFQRGRDLPEEWSGLGWMRAGTMVTATKSLFLALAPQAALVDTLSRSTRALKSMNLRKLSMALILGRYHQGRLFLAMAGMPPVLVHRAKTDEVESIEVGGMPLGAMARIPYREVEVDFEPGDTVLLMSDGLPERRDRGDELIGYERTTAAFGDLCSRPLDAVVTGLRKLADDWSDGLDADDDTTFVLLRAKGP